MTRTLPHAVDREDRPDGAILLRSRHALGPVADRSTDWLHRWAAETPGAICLAEREGDGWREVTYADALARVRALAAGLLRRGLTADTPILIISGNGVDHGLLTLAAQYVGIPSVPVAEQYALIPGAHQQLAHVADLTRPGLVYAEDGARFGAALELDCLAGIPKVVSRTPGRGAMLLDDLAATPDPALDAANAAVGPDTVAKILMTSGSTSAPKGVITTQRMMCVNQAQLQTALPMLTARPQRVVDWLPWNHVFGGSHNFNMMLSTGGALYIDDGKPTPDRIARTIENLKRISGTLAFNVPIGFSLLAEALRDDPALRRSYFAELDLIFYAGASLPQTVWDTLEGTAREERGQIPLITSSWGLTETAPCAIVQHEKSARAGVVGVPVPGVTVKLVPEDGTRHEVRIKGPSIFPGYYRDPDRTAAAFDEEGYFITGDALRFVDPGDASQGLFFDGRISEDFKLLSGTWVRASALRMTMLGRLRGLASDLVVTGADRGEVGLLILPTATLRSAEDASETDGALVIPSAAEDIAQRLAAEAGQGSASRIARALILAEPPSLPDGEITAKGNLNFRKLLTRRAALLDRLYDDSDPATIKVERPR